MKAEVAPVASDVATRVSGGVKAAAAVAAATDGDGAKSLLAKGKKLLTPEDDVEWILSRKRGVFAPHKLPHLSQETMESMVDGVEAFNYLADSFYKMQAEIRAELDAKGYLEVDGDYFERREEYRQMVEEELADLWDGIVFTEDELSKD